MDSTTPDPTPKQQQQQQQPPPQQQQPQQQQQSQVTQPQQQPPPQQQQQQQPQPQPQQAPQQQQQPTHPMQYHQVPHNQQHPPPNPMAGVPQGQPPPPPPGYMQYPPHPQAPPHPHYYPHQQQQMQPHPQSPYAVQQHTGAPPVPHHPQQSGPMYSPHASHAPHAPHGPHPSHPHPASGHQPPPHWVTHGPPPPPPHQQPHPQQHPMQQHPSSQQHPSHYQSSPQHQHPQQPQPHPAYHPYGHQPPPPQQTHQPQPHPMQYHQVHNQQHAPHPMAQNPYMQYPQAHPHYYPHHPQQMQPPPHQSPYAVGQPPPPHAGGPPQIGPHPQPHPQQTGPIYSPHPPPHPHQPPSHQPHWVHGPHQQPPPPQPHPQQHIMQHPPQQLPPHTPQPTYYQPTQPPHTGPPPQQLPPPASPHHPPSRTHTPQQQHPPTSQTPTRVVPPPSSTPASPSTVPKVEKKDITFPKNSVEATKPVATKKRKITSKDVTDIEVWRLLMCLKSGLLAESSWAIDVLSILLNDDSTLMYFGLQHMPGLLEAVLEHFKCCLNELFGGMVSDTTLKPMLSETKPMEKAITIKKENGLSNNNNNNNVNINNNNINGVKNDSIVSKVVINKRKINGVVENISPTINIPLGDQIIMLNTAKNYTFKTRDGRVVKMKNGVTPVKDDPSYELVFKPAGYSHWQEGNGEDTSHIQVYFEPDNFIESSRRCTCLSTIIRNLSFIPGNDVEMSKHAGLLLVLGRLLLLKHDDIVPNEADSAPNEWHLLSSLREDTLVIISNISSSLDLSPYNDKINLSLLDGLLHWACCSSSYALDPFPAPSMTVSPQRLALESLAKLSIIEGNVDLILATPPWSRIEKLFGVLARLLNINEDQTIREFSLVLLSNLTSADSGIARKVALTGSAIPKLISFLETSIADPEAFATTQDMLRRAAVTLKCLSQLVDNHPLFAQHQQRLLNLVMSQKLDQEVVPIIADVIFEISLSD